MKISILILFAVFALSSCKQQVLNKTAQGVENSKIKVGVFKGNGAGAVSVIETIEALKIDTGIIAVPISAAEIQKGALANFDAIIIPGGSGSKQLNNLGESGADKLRDFVTVQGKGIVGICAGAYFLSSTAGYPNLHLASSIHLDRPHYNRGRGLVQFAITKNGNKIFPELEGKNTFLQYYDGPVLSQSDSTKGEYTELGVFVTDIHPDNFAPAGFTPGKTFLLNEDVGKGRVFLCAGHPESTPGMRWMAPRMVRWVCKSELVSYNTKWVRPEINDKAILFDRQLRKHEKEIFWRLFSEDPKEQISAMDSLYALRSRPAVRWSIGLLRSNNPSVRKHAAELLKLTEYSDALPDLKAAYDAEQNSETKLSIKSTIDFLENK